VVLTSATAFIGTTTVTVLVGVGSGVVLVPTAVFVMLPVAAVTVAFTISVSVWPTARLALPTTVVLVPTCVGVPLLLLELIRLKPALSMSLIVTFCATLGPRFTSVTV
jgi:hypothetical protein